MPSYHCGILTVSIQLPSFTNVYIPNNRLGNCKLLLSQHEQSENNCIHVGRHRTRKMYFPWPHLLKQALWYSSCTVCCRSVIQTKGIWVRRYGPKRWQQKALHYRFYFIFKCQISNYFILNMLLIILKLLFSKHRFKVAVESGCPSTKGDFKRVCPEGDHTPHCSPKLQRPERVCGPPCQHSENAYERKRLWWHWI